MRKSTNLSKKLTILFLLAIIGGFGTIKTIFVWKGERLKNVAYKSINLIVQTLKKGSANKKTLVVIGNGWNVSVDANDRVTEHAPFFLIPNDEVQLLICKCITILHSLEYNFRLEDKQTRHLVYPLFSFLLP